jgi:hypothetical protein
MLSAWEVSLEQFARENRVSVLSDAYDADDCPPVPRYSGNARPPTPSSPERLLDQLCSAYDYHWNAAAPVYLFRRRDWYTLRERQIPDSQRQRWMDHAAVSDRFELADLAEMAALPEGQRSKLFRYVGPDATREVGRNPEVLAFYAALTTRQRSALPREGVSVNDLTLAQQRALAPVCSKVPPPQMAARADPTRVRVLEEADHTSIVLQFRDGTRHEFAFQSRPPKGLDPWAQLRQ